MCIEIGRKYVPGPNLQNLRAIGKLHGYFDRGILNGTDRCREAGSGAELVCDQENMVSDFHAYLTAAGLEFMNKSSTIFSPVLANLALVLPSLDQFLVLRGALLRHPVPNDLRRQSFKIVEVTARMRYSKAIDPARAPSYCATLVKR
jgi:hypothetical protein